MVKLSGMTHDPATWSCVIRPDCDNPEPNMFPKAQVLTVVTAKFARRAPEAFKFVSSVSWSNEVVNAVLAWKDKNQATAEETAEHFLKNYAEVWGKWVTPEAAKKVKAAL